MNTRIILVLFSVVVFLQAGKAQQPFQREFNVGGSFGANLSSVSFVPRVQENQMLTFNAGVTARWITEKHFGIQAELNFAQHGWDETFDDTQYYYSRKLNTIELPLLTHIYFGNHRARFILNLGPQIGYNFSDHINENVSGVTPLPPPNDNSYVVAQRTLPIKNHFLWGICGGPGFELRTGIGYFILEGRYFYGLGDIFGNGKTDAFGKSSPQTITVKLSYLFKVF